MHVCRGKILREQQSPLMVIPIPGQSLSIEVKKRMVETSPANQTSSVLPVSKAIPLRECELEQGVEDFQSTRELYISLTDGKNSDQPHCSFSLRDHVVVSCTKSLWRARKTFQLRPLPNRIAFLSASFLCSLLTSYRMPQSWLSGVCASVACYIRKRPRQCSRLKRRR